MEINYTRTDTLNKNFIDTDTLSFNIRKSARDRRAENKEKEKEKKNEEVEEKQIRFLNINSNVQSSFELFNPIRFEFEQPVFMFDSSLVRLEMAVDTLFEKVHFQMESDTLNPRKFTIRPRWEPGGKYKITVDSATLISHYGIWNNKYEQSFTVKALDQYGNLEVNISGLPEGKKAFVELLDKSDKPFRKSFVKGNQVRFQDLLPGDIYARMVIDDNGDGVWTTGNYEAKRQPEMVYYYPGKWVIRAYSDHLEEWQIDAVPAIRQKPLEITKNKPEEKKKRDPNRDRDNQQQNQQSSPFGSGGGRGSGGMTGMQQTGGRR